MSTDFERQNENPGQTGLSFSLQRTLQEALKLDPAKYFFFLLCALVFAGVLDRKDLSALGNFAFQQAGTLCKDLPFLVGFIIMLLLWLCYRIFSGTWDFSLIIIGLDKRLSTSKCQFFLWTIAVIFAYTALYAARVGIHRLDLQTEIPRNLLLAMGFSVASAVTAKQITTQQVNSGAVTKPAATQAERDAGNLVKDDNGAIDLTKVQVLGWTLVAIGAFIVKSIHCVLNPATVTELPNIDTSLMVLMGLGHGAYLGKKLITTTTPAIYGVSPVRAKPGAEITLTGLNFGATEFGSVVTIDGIVPASPVQITQWSDTQVKFLLPQTGVVSGRRALAVTVDADDSNPVTLTVLRMPDVTGVERLNASLCLRGSGFGQQVKGDRFTLNDTPPVRISAWNDDAIVFDNPDPQRLLVGAAVNVKLFLDGDSSQPTAQFGNLRIG